MLCVSSVVLFSSGQYRVKCDIQKFREIWMVHSQPALELSKQKIYITMHIALESASTEVVPNSGPSMMS